MFGLRLAASMFSLLTCAALPAQAPTAPVDPLAALLALQAQPAVAKGAEVEVVDADGKPCPGAVLMAAQIDRSSREAIDLRLRQLHPGRPVAQYAAMMLEHGTRYALDEHGRAALPLESDTLLFALFGETAGITGLRLNPHGRTPKTSVKLAARQQASVLVTDADGKPLADVPVGVGSYYYFRPGGVAQTAADGTAEVVAWSVPSRNRVVGALVATRKAVEEPFAEGAQVRLQLPVCGSVRAAMQPAGTAARFELSIARDAGRKLTCPPTSSGADSARFAFVEPGAEGSVLAYVDGIAGPLSVPLPTVEPGKEVEVVVDLEAGPSRLCFKVLGLDGQALADASVVATWQVTNGSRGLTVKTDAEGRLDLPVQEGAAGDGKLVLQWGNDNPLMPVVEGYGELPLQDLKPGPNPRDDLRLLPAPVVLSGRVLDAHQRPVSGLLLRDSTGRASSSRPSDEDGRFELRMVPPAPGSLRLAAMGDEWFLQDATASYVAGSTGLHVDVLRAARLLVQVTPPLGEIRNSLQFQCTRPDGTGEPVTAAFAPQDKELRLPEGRWDLSLSFSNGDEVARFDNVIADGGVENHDPRLMQLDWTKFASVATIHVEGPDGEPCDDCTVWHYVERNGGGRSGQGSSPSDGLARLLVPKEGGIITIDPRDKTLRSVDLGVFKGETTVKLLPAPKVRFVLTGLPKLPEGAAYVVTVRGSARSAPMNQLEADQDGVFTGCTRSTGSHSLQLMVRKGNTSWSVGQVKAGIEVGDAGVDQTIEIDEAMVKRCETTIGRLK